MSDASAPRLWQFSLDTQEFSSYSFDGLTTSFLTLDNKGRIWFSDTPRNQIGFIDLKSKEIPLKTIPELDPVISQNSPLGIQADFDGNIWITIVNKDRIVKYVPELDVFEEIRLETESIPFALAVDQDGKIWYTATNSGKIGFIDPKNNE